ncbi:N-6 DNA methylase [Streptomyces sp. NPDC096068]|uniref:N-6 DNA methylase n=1 Tax=Streptomyces sp. NPDC096068 TaxID=3155424 RepID=UPI0033316658
MTSDAVVTAAEIARIAGVGPAAVSNWRKRHPDFPTPVAGTASSPQFSLDETVEWLRAHGRSVTISPVDVLWQNMNALRDPARPAAVLAAAGTILARGGRTGAETDHRLPDDVADRITRLGAELGESAVFEALLDRWTEAHSRQVEVTPRPVAALMADLVSLALGAAPKSVLDPACGTGGLLRELPEAENRLGQDVDPDLTEVARIRIGLQTGVEAVTRTGDSLLDDAFPDRRVQAVVCNPPFGQRSWRKKEMGYDPRWVYGFPPASEPELAWLQHALSHLDDDGFAAVLMPAAAASRTTGRHVRADLVRQGALRAVFALPSQGISGHGAGAHLWLAAAPDEGDTPRVLLVDTERLYASSRDGEPSPANWPLLHETATFLWREFLAGKEADNDACRMLPVHDLLDGEVDLTPSRHLRTDDDQVLDLRLVEEYRDRLQRELKLLMTGPPPVEEVPAGTRSTAFVSLDDLVSTGAVRMWRGTAKADTDQEGELAHTVITLEQALRRTPPTERTSDDVGGTVEEGDILMFAAGPEGARPVDPAEYGAIPGVGITVLRPDPRVIDSWFLAGVLAYGSHRQPGTSTSSNRVRVDGARLCIPVRGLEEQRRVGEAFRALFRFQDSLERLAEEGRAMTRHLAGALAGGSVRPVE